MFFHGQASAIHTLLSEFLDDAVDKFFKGRLTPLFSEPLLPRTIFDDLVFISRHKSFKGVSNYTVKNGIFRFCNLFDFLW